MEYAEYITQSARTPFAPLFPHLDDQLYVNFSPSKGVSPCTQNTSSAPPGSLRNWLSTTEHISCRICNRCNRFVVAKLQEGADAPSLADECTRNSSASSLQRKPAHQSNDNRREHPQVSTKGVPALLSPGILSSIDSNRYFDGPWHRNSFVPQTRISMLWRVLGSANDLTPHIALQVRHGDSVEPCHLHCRWRGAACRHDHERTRRRYITTSMICRMPSTYCATKSSIVHLLQRVSQQQLRNSIRTISRGGRRGGYPRSPPDSVGTLPAGTEFRAGDLGKSRV